MRKKLLKWASIILAAGISFIVFKNPVLKPFFAPIQAEIQTEIEEIK